MRRSSFLSLHALLSSLSPSVMDCRHRRDLSVRPAKAAFCLFSFFLLSPELLLVVVGDLLLLPLAMSLIHFLAALEESCYTGLLLSACVPTS